MKGLSRLRSQIETLDLKILRLLNQRLNLSAEVGRVKRRTRRSAFAPEREEYLLRFLEEKNQGPLLPAHLRSIYHEIFSSSRSRQAPLTIGYLGAPLSGALIAARTRFGAVESYRPHASWKALAQALRSGQADVGVIPSASLAEASGAASPLGKTLQICGEIPHKERIAPESHYLIAQANQDAEHGVGAKSIFRISLPATANRSGLPRWCRDNHLKALKPSDGLLLETDGSGKTPAPSSLSASLQSAFGSPSRLALLGTFAPQIHGR